MELKHFNKGSRDEFLCKCGECQEGIEQMNEEFLRMLDNAREFADTSFVINSGYRCPRCNRKVGSISDNHPAGRAVDIKAIDSRTRYQIIRGALKAGFNRIGLHKAFIHLDNMPDPEASQEVIWVY